jgi:membrane dipeptidase
MKLNRSQARLVATDSSATCIMRSVSRRSFLRRLWFAAAAIGSEKLVFQTLLRDNTLMAEAAELSREAVTIDLHCHPNDLPSSYFPAPDPDLVENMQAGRLDNGVFAARGDYPLIKRDAAGRRYDARKPQPGELFRRCTEQLDPLIEATKKIKLTLARSPTDIIQAKKAGSPSALLAIEGGDPLEGDLSRVQVFFDRGVRVLQLMHYRINEIGDIQTDYPRHNGLTGFGREVVREMNKLGMVVDTAHCSPDTLAGVLAESRFPVIFAHTGAYAQRKLGRHLQDKDMRAIANKGGIVGIWPYLGRRDTFESFLKDIDSTQQLIGSEHVGVATDLFGLDNHTAIPTHKEFALIPAALLKRGYTDAAVEKIVGANFLHLFRDVTENH